MIIKPINSQDNSSISKVNFSECEETLRNYYNISIPRIITFLQVEINNTNDKSLINQVEYEVYNDNKEKLDISICSDSNIQIHYLIKANSSLDLSAVSYFKDSNIDVFNIKDKFFSDICTSFSYNNKDVILEDIIIQWKSIIDFFQNYTLCEENCLFNEIDLNLMNIICDCSIKANLSVIEPKIKLEELEDIETNMAFSIIKCYNLAFSWNGKYKNIGFWLFLIFNILDLILIVLYFNKGIKPIKEYIFKEMAEYGYINKKGKEKDKIQKKNEKRWIFLRKKRMALNTKVLRLIN